MEAIADVRQSKADVCLLLLAGNQFGHQFRRRRFDDDNILSGRFERSQRNRRPEFDGTIGSPPELRHSR